MQQVLRQAKAAVDQYARPENRPAYLAVMADALYGQVVASAQGLGLLADPAQLAAHLRAAVDFGSGEPVSR